MVMMNIKYYSNAVTYTKSNIGDKQKFIMAMVKKLVKDDNGERDIQCQSVRMF